MKPTVGRIVHWYPSPGAIEDNSPQAAMITYCYPKSDTVNLVIYQRYPGDYKGLMEKVPFSPEPQLGHWSWPPIT